MMMWFKSKPKHEAETEALRAAQASGAVDAAKLELAAWLGYGPAVEVLGESAPIVGCMDWMFLQHVPAMTGVQLGEQGLLPKVGRDNQWPAEQAVRAVIGWARGALAYLDGTYGAQAFKRVDAATRYVLDRSMENDIPLGLLFGDAPRLDPVRRSAWELSQFACRLAADPQPRDVASLLRMATQRAGTVHARDPGLPWPRRDLTPALTLLRAALVPWALGQDDPLLDGLAAGLEQARREHLWVRAPRAKWRRLVR